MRATTYKIIFFVWLSSGSCHALDLSFFERQCEDIGFKRKTSDFGECVLELRSRSSATEKPKSIEQGDGSAEHLTCVKYGFTPGHSDYAQCRLQIDLAKKQAIEQQRLYEAQVSAQKKARDRAQAESLLFMGLGMMSGRPPGSGYGNTQQIQAPPTTRIYTLPGGKTMHCSTVGITTDCY